MLVWFGCYGLSVGPIPYAIAAEAPAARLRMKTIALGRNTYNVFSVVNHVVAPYLLNTAEANLHGKAAFPAAVFSSLLLVWAWFGCPRRRAGRSRSWTFCSSVIHPHANSRVRLWTVAGKVHDSAGGAVVDGRK